MKRSHPGRAAPARAATIHKKTSKPKRPKAATKSSRDKVRDHRARLRARGLRLVQMWLPDTRSRTFARQAHQDSVAIARSASDAGDQAWIDAASWWNSHEAKVLELNEPSAPWWRDDEPSK